MIKFESINHSFADKKLFNNFNLQIKEGEFVTIMGDNGAGKSTLCNLISGALFPNGGKIILDGLEVTNQNEHLRAKYIAHVFQDPKVGTNSKMTVRENLSLALHKCDVFSLKRAVAKENDKLFIELLAELGMGLEHCLNQTCSSLSGGQRQALSLIMATLNKPKILLLDEHTAALDPTIAKIILEKTDQIVRKNNLTAAMITHNIPSAVKYGDRFIFLREGKIMHDINGVRTAENIANMFEL